MLTYSKIRLSFENVGKGKIWSILVLIFLFLASFLLLRHYYRKRKTVSIGLLVNLSGPGGKAGRYIRDGFLFAIGMQKRLKLKCPLEFRVFIGDYDESDDLLKRKIDELYKKGVKIFVGPVTSHSSYIALSHAEKTGKNLLLITPYTATTKLSGRKDCFVRTSPDNHLFVKALHNWLQKKGIRSLAVVMDISNPEFVFDIYRALEKEGLKPYPFKVNSKNFKVPLELLEFLKNEKVPVVLFLTKTRETVLLAQKLRDEGYRGSFVATVWAQTPELVKWGGSAVEGLTIISFVKPRYNNPIYRLYDATFYKLSGYHLNARAVRTVEVVQVLCKALREARSGDPKKVLTSLVGKHYDTIMGRLFINEYGDAERPFYEIRVGSGEFHVIREIPNEP